MEQGPNWAVDSALDLTGLSPVPLFTNLSLKMKGLTVSIFFFHFSNFFGMKKHFFFSMEEYFFPSSNKKLRCKNGKKKEFYIGIIL